MKSWLKLLVFGSFLAVATQACDGCRPGGGVRQKGEVRVVYIDPVTNMQNSGENGLYDFGTVSMGKTESRKLTVTNVGLGTLTIQKFAKTSGDNAKVGSFIDEAPPVFTVAFDSETTVDRAQALTFGCARIYRNDSDGLALIEEVLVHADELDRPDPNDL